MLETVIVNFRYLARANSTSIYTTLQAIPTAINIAIHLEKGLSSRGWLFMLIQGLVDTVALHSRQLTEEIPSIVVSNASHSHVLV